MARGELRAVVATSSLDLGIDWGGGRPGDPGRRAEGRQPPAAARRPRQPPHGRGRRSRVLVPANRFEVLECEAAIRRRRRESWTATRPRPGGARRAGAASAGLRLRRRRSTPGRCMPRCARAAPYAGLTRARLRRRAGLRRAWRLRAAQPTTAPQAVPRRRGPLARAPAPSSPGSYRMNVGTIVEAPMLKVRLCRRLRHGARRGRGVFRQHAAARATPSCSPAGCCASCGIREMTRRMQPTAAAASPWCRPMPAAACR